MNNTEQAAEQISQGLRRLAEQDMFQRRPDGVHPAEPFQVRDEPDEVPAHLNPLAIEQLPNIVQRLIAVIRKRFPFTARQLEETADLLRQRADQCDAMARELRTAEASVSDSLHYWISFENRSSEIVKVLHEIASQPVHDGLDQEADRHG